MRSTQLHMSSFLIFFLIMVHEDAVIITGLVLHLDHPDVVIGVICLGEIIVVVEITVNVLQIGKTTSMIGTTVLVNTIRDIATQMVSPW